MQASANETMGRLLYIEDEQSYRDIVAQRLHEYFHLDFAATMAEGISKGKDCHYDAIILDPGLSDADRNTALTKLKESHPETAIVILTGYDDEQWIREQIRSCASGVIIKGKSDVEPMPFANQIKRAILTHQTCRAIDKAAQGYSI